jgi:hypothetical protein
VKVKQGDRSERLTKGEGPHPAIGATVTWLPHPGALIIRP